MQIGELCRVTGMTKDSIRFYEKIGLLNNVERKLNGYKNYSDEHVKQLKLLRHAKKLGFTLNEIKDLATLFYSNNLSAKEMDQYLKTKEQEIDEKISALQLFKQEIKRKREDECRYKGELR